MYITDLFYGKNFAASTKTGIVNEIVKGPSWTALVCCLVAGESKLCHDDVWRKLCLCFFVTRALRSSHDNSRHRWWYVGCCGFYCGILNAIVAVLYSLNMRQGLVCQKEIRKKGRPSCTIDDVHTWKYSLNDFFPHEHWVESDVNPTAQLIIALKFLGAF